MASRRERGLCYNCDERFSPGHRCKSRCFLIITDDEADFPCTDVALPAGLTTGPTTEPDLDSEPPPAQISLHALSGQVAPQTIRVVGQINGHNVVVLIDGGSTHYFIQEKMAHFLKLPAFPSPGLSVLVGNGAELPCTQICSDVKLGIQGHTFTVDLHVMALGGADIVLGVTWLKSLSPITTDYSNLTVSFTHNSTPIILHGQLGLGPSAITNNQMKRIVSTNRAAALFHITLDPYPPSPSIETTPEPPEIQKLLHRYSTLFNTPSSLPPQRTTDHSIHLVSNADPVNLRPYRYPHFQKQEIERQVDAMLQSGLIRPSRSPFSSPILLVKKKDGTWRFCVD